MQFLIIFSVSRDIELYGGTFSGTHYLFTRGVKQPAYIRNGHVYFIKGVSVLAG